MARRRGIKARVTQTLDKADAAIDATTAMALEVLGEILDGVEFHTSIDWGKRTAVTRLKLREEGDEDDT
jgi:hypothetical protein